MPPSATAALTRNGTMGRVYGGDPNLVHIPDGQRRRAGALIAEAADRIIRAVSENIPWPMRQFHRLCPGCYMVAIFNAAVALARANGQPLDELGRSLGKAFYELAALNPSGGPVDPATMDEGIEEIEVLLDAEDDPRKAVELQGIGD